MFKLRGSLLVHHRVVHNPSDEGAHHCKVCNRKFTNRYRKELHEKKHNDAREFECVKCGMAFEEKGEFEVDELSEYSFLEMRRLSITCVLRYSEARTPYSSVYNAVYVLVGILDWVARKLEANRKRPRNMIFLRNATSLAAVCNNIAWPVSRMK